MKKFTLITLLVFIASLGFAQRNVDFSQLKSIPVKQNVLKKVKGHSRTAATTTMSKAPRKAASLVEPPLGKEAEEWYITDGHFVMKDEEGNQIDAADQWLSIGVIIDGNDIYIQGLPYYFDEAWVKGTISGSTVTIPTGQLVGTDDYGDEYIVGFNKETESIADVINEEDGTSVCVKGIVMSSLVNQTGFYINDGTGVIAVRTTEKEMEGIAVGNEVVMEGSRKHIVKSGSSNVGQSCIDNATCVANLFGNHPYDKSTFITNKTFDEIVTSEKYKQATEDLTCNVYVAKCHLRKSGSQYSTNYYLSNAAHDKEFSLYAGSGTQYSAFDAFSDDREITVEFMLVDWNTKSEYRACIVSASDGTTTILNTLNFQ